MKKWVLLFVLALAWPAHAQTRHGLLLAVGHYAAYTGWSDTGAANDARLIEAALRQQGFIQPNIRVVADAAATKTAIVAELQALAARVKPGDIVVFHFSGHGQQVQDDNNDEADGFDEAIVPYDAPKHYSAGQYEGQRHLRDDELGSLLGAIRQRLGTTGQLLVLLDACHSGTGTRGLGRARGTTEPMAPAAYAPTTTCQADCSFGLADAVRMTQAAPMVCYFGASPHELNYETTDGQGKSVGALSWAFAQALNSCITVPTYEVLFDRIRTRMMATSPNQTPQLEGPASGQLFKGVLQSVAPHYRALSWPSAQQVIINGGTLQGLHPQTTVALYPPGVTPGKATPLASGHLVTSNLTTALVALDRPVIGAARGSWFNVTARNYGPLSISLRLDLADQELLVPLEAALQTHPFIQVRKTGPADLTLEANNTFTQGNNLQLSTVQDQIIYRRSLPAPPADVVNELLSLIGRMAQAKYLRGLVASTAAIQLTLEIVPVTVRHQGEQLLVDQRGEPATHRDGTGQLRYQTGEYCQLRVTNKGTRSAYFTVLDIQPDDKLHVLLPAPRDEPADCFVRTGETRLLPDLIHLSPPYGREMFKLIGATQPLDLRALVTSQGRELGRGATSPFTQLLATSYLVAGSRGDSANLPADAISTTEVVFLLGQPQP